MLLRYRAETQEGFQEEDFPGLMVSKAFENAFVFFFYFNHMKTTHLYIYIESVLLKASLQNLALSLHINCQPSMLVFCSIYVSTVC